MTAISDRESSKIRESLDYSYSTTFISVLGMCRDGSLAPMTFSRFTAASGPKIVVERSPGCPL